MTSDSIIVARYVLFDVDIMTQDIKDLKLNLRSRVIDNLVTWSLNKNMADEATEIAYQCVLQLREIILNCLRNMTAIATASSTEMNLNRENFYNVFETQYSEERYPLPKIVFKESQIIDIVRQYISERGDVIQYCYKVIEDKLNNHKRLGKNIFKNLHELHSYDNATTHPLYDFELDHLWRRYLHRWEETHPQVVKTETHSDSKDSPFAKTSKSAAENTFNC